MDEQILIKKFVVKKCVMWMACEVYGNVERYTSCNNHDVVCPVNALNTLHLTLSPPIR